jgi:hypothetical protein
VLPRVEQRVGHTPACGARGGGSGGGARSSTSVSSAFEAGPTVAWHCMTQAVALSALTHDQQHELHARATQPDEHG